MTCWNIMLIVGAVFVVQGCSRQHAGATVIQERVLSQKNPTDYLFSASVAEVKNAVKRAVEKMRQEDRQNYKNRIWQGKNPTHAERSLSDTLQGSELGMLFWKGDADSLVNGVFTKPENNNDAYIFGVESPIGESQVYFEEGIPLIVFADFHIHLTAIAVEKTKVEIVAYDYRIVSGLADTASGHGARFITYDVPPTTIEEYRILRAIGEALGTTNMPPLIKPGPNSPTNEVTISRE